MSRSWLFPFALMFTLSPIIASALCLRNEPGYFWNYAGDLSSSLRIRMTLVFSGSEIKGRYVYASQLKDIELKGRIIDGKEIILDEIDAVGQVAGQFTGQFPERDPRGLYGNSKLECDVIVGTWQKQGSLHQRPFYLHSVDATSGSLSHRYGAAGASNDDVVNRNAQRFWGAVERGDKATVAAQIRYPIDITLDGRRRALRSPHDVVKNYDAIFTPGTREAILKDIPRYMFVRDEGIMLADGVVWFGPDGKVISLMPLP